MLPTLLRGTVSCTDTMNRQSHLPLPVAGSVGAGRPSAPRGPGADGPGAAVVVAAIRQPVRPDGAPASIPPEQWLRAVVLQVLYTVRSERLVMEQLHYNLLFRWFVGLNMDDPVWHPTTFTQKIGIGCVSLGMAYFQRRSKHFGLCWGHLLIVAI